MEFLTSEDSPANDLYYSCPSSPSRLSFNFHPTSFTNVATTTTPISYRKTTSLVSDDFEFETSQTFETWMSMEKELKQEHVVMQDSPLMSFADELFSNGQVLPLKLPPCRMSPMSTYSSPTSPAARKSKRGISPVRRLRPFNNNNNDPDPFEVALEHVKKDAIRGKEPPHRRTRSMSPMRTTPRWLKPIDNKGVAAPQPYSEQATSMPPRAQTNASLPSPTLRSRQATDTLNKSVTTKTDEPSYKKRHGMSMKWFLFNSASEGRSDSKDKLRTNTAACKDLDHEDLRHLSFKSIHETLYNEKRREQKAESMRRRTLMPYRPQSMLVCFGFPSRGVGNVN